MSSVDGGSGSMGRGNTGVRIGILSVQGDVAENAAAISSALKDPRGFGDDSVTLVKTPQQVEELDGLVIPGGESTTIGRLSDANGTLEAIRSKIARDGMPVLGICAGLIMLAKSAGNPASVATAAAAAEGAEAPKSAQPLLGVLDIDVTRNAFGRQNQSFEAKLDIRPLAIPDFKGVFIRAPLISRVAPDVTVLCELPPAAAGGSGDVATVDGSGPGNDGADDDGIRAGPPHDHGQGGIVAVSKGSIIGTSFHPELSGDLAVHKHFVALVRRHKRG